MYVMKVIRAMVVYISPDSMTIRITLRSRLGRFLEEPVLVNVLPTVLAVENPSS
jgi:hypothetical protein